MKLPHWLYVVAAVALAALQSYLHSGSAAPSVVSVLTAIVTILALFQQPPSDPPKPPPLKLVGGACLLLALQPGCGGSTAATQQAEVATYASQQLLCVKFAPTKGQSDDCRAEVKAFWCGDGGALREAGACSYDTPVIFKPDLSVLDGGKE
jgi:hypothetical protein